MEKFLEALLKIIPFAHWLEQAGLSKETAVVLSGAILAALFWLLKTGLERWKISRIARDLAPYFYEQQVEASRRYFIPTKFQNESPVREEEPGHSLRFVAKEPLIPFFIKTAFDEKKESDKFYLILADSGMGKTTFMINLYMRYTAFFNFGRKYNIRLLPFGDSRIWDKIKGIKEEEAKRTILLLDAFDEDKKLLPTAQPDGLNDDERFRRRLDEIIEAVRDFREVIITSRTQYFPGQEKEPYELKVPRFDDKGFHKLAKFYLSPLDPKEIRRYLRKKYGVLRFWNRAKKKQAETIMNRSLWLMARPMLLSYIDYLVESRQDFKTTYQIYETLIEQWIEREAVKRKHQTGDREKFRRDLHAYSRLVALEIYRQRQTTAQLHLSKTEALEVARNNNIADTDLADYEITGQSLLTRDAEGNWKFAHKSIFEFLIAKEAAENTAFWQEATLDGLDMAAKFFKEKCPDRPLPGFKPPDGFVSIKGGAFLMGSPENETDRIMKRETQHPVKVSDFYLAKYTVTLAQFEEFVQATGYKTDADKDGGSYLWNGKEWQKKAGVNWRCDVNGMEQADKNHPVIHVSWNDAVAYCQWLTDRFSKSARFGKSQFRLPTEAEWEYACRAGTTTPFNTGDNLTTDQANYDGNHPYKNYPKGKYLQKTTPVGSYPPNAWGLYDLHGNVWEWCGDWYAEKYYDECKKRGTVENPTGPEKGSRRVMRGSSWSRNAQSCRSAYRYDYSPAYRSDRVGFRLLFVP